MDKLLARLVVALARTPLILIVLEAAFIALVSFGAPAGVSAGMAPRFFLGVTEGIVCPRGSEMVFEEWGDGSYQEFSTTCIDAAGNPVKERFFLALAVYLGAWFLVIFYIAFAGLFIARTLLRKKFGIEP